jgi:hypothetical protein
MSPPPTIRRDRARNRRLFTLYARRTGGAGRGEVGHWRSASLRSLSRTALGWLVCFVVSASASASDFSILQPAAFAHHVQRFNTMEDENVTNFVSNAASWDWLQQNIPLFECPDREVEELYYFRWWSFRKHLVRTANGFVFTEFLTPVRHAGVFNTVSCAAGFHLAEGRWLRDPEYLDDYIRFWLRGNAGKPPPHFHKYSSWFAAAAYDRYLVNADQKFIAGLLNDLVADYRVWEQERQSTNGLFWQYDVRDGMEESISGSRTNRNLRPTINSYMFGNAKAIAAIARGAGKTNLAAEFDAKAARLKNLVQEKLWNPDARFFEVLRDDGRFARVREETGFVPWMFHLPDVAAGVSPAVEPGLRPGGTGVNGKARMEKQNASSGSGADPGGNLPPSTSGRMPDATVAWAQLADRQGFQSPFGLTTAERRSPLFRSHGYGTCEWDGAVWPFATSQTLNALANVLRDYPQNVVAPRDYFDAFLTYVHSQHAGGKPYIGEYLDETTGDWINGKSGRSRYYNHSTFADLLITGVVGLRPRSDHTVEVWPLLPADTWAWFCLDGVAYHGRRLTIVWDRDGSRYGRGAGLRVLADGKEIAKSEKLQRLAGKLP